MFHLVVRLSMHMRVFTYTYAHIRFEDFPFVCHL